MAFNENTRVKLPAILHLCRLGYEYISLKNVIKDDSTNIFTDIFAKSITRINPDEKNLDIKRLLDNINVALDADDLGQEFYKLLTDTSGTKLIDFKNFENNTFNVVTELSCKNGDEEFRPDITLLINGMPLAFIEVKKPNNKDGILAERKRINDRFQNRKFKKFINISQILVFSNNMQYDTESIVPIMGAFYASTAREEANFNCFREEEIKDWTALLLDEDSANEISVLRDNNSIAIRDSAEFLTNKSPDTPTNKILTSIFSKDRFAMLLKYGLAYVKAKKGIEKHIMRYPQIFATKAIERSIESGKRKGIIWHTQGSGKTALSYFNVKYLTDYFQKKNIIPKFYFIVDRIDLLLQAQKEFSSRDLVVHTVDSKEELIKDFKINSAIHNLSGKQEITVVNIQKFENETNILTTNDYNIKQQRIYFLDEVHRSYNPKGSFLANLMNSDKSAIIIGLTGTPLIGEFASKEIFGDYIHKYYYNSSIADGYTLKLIREGIETTYQLKLKKILKEIELLKGEADRRYVYSHEKFVEPMLDYIIDDFLKSRISMNKTIGAMVICDSSEQAKKMFELFNEKYALDTNNTEPKPTILEQLNKINIAAEPNEADLVQENIFNITTEPEILYSATERIINKSFTGSLILHDVGTKEERKRDIDNYKDGNIDILFVDRMLLTGFDASRLKRLYIGRVIKRHNLLQALTRVNRPYSNFKYGYVIDFADITKEFELTNKAYFDELQLELGNELDTYSNIFKTKEEIEIEIDVIKEKLFQFDLKNAEIFSQQITEIEDRKLVLEVKKALESAKELYNIIRLSGQYELLDRIDFKKLNELYKETSNHLELLNTKIAITNDSSTINLLNVALENVVFMFRKVSESELIIADKLKDTLRKTREAMNNNIDTSDPIFVTLYEELMRLFKKKNLDEISQEEMKANITSLQEIYDRVTELNRKNNLLKAKYNNDAKYAKVHKRIMENGTISKKELLINEILLKVKNDADDLIQNNQRILNNEAYFGKFVMSIVNKSFKDFNLNLDSDSIKFINNNLVKEYMNEYNGAFL
jgi:type I restriction enzyme R subunit